MGYALLQWICQVLHLFSFFLTTPLVIQKAEESIRYSITMHGILLYKELNVRECKIRAINIVSKRRKSVADSEFLREETEA